MPRYIDADRLKEHKFAGVQFEHYSKIVSDGREKTEAEIYAYKVGYNEAIDNIVDFEPTADVVKREKGRWIDMDNHVMCSCCGAAHYGVDKNFCPTCGAKMDLD